MAKQLSIVEKLDALFKRIDHLEEENVQLRKQVNYLTDRLSKYETPKNSSNSNMPPSSDFPKQNKTQSLRTSSGKKPGGQAGHKGNTLKMSDNPDIIQEIKPQSCACCGKLLERQHFVAAGRRQVVDIPPITPVVTEYQIFSAQCICGHKTTAAYPEGVQTPVSYGSNVQALVAYMSARQYMPVARMAEFFSSVLGLKISTGGICYLLDKSKSKLALQYEYIRRFVLESPIIGADETGVNIKGKNHWAWVFQTHLASFFGIHKNRGIKAINELMPEGFNGSALVTDCWGSYFKNLTELHQLCTSHLMRELKYFAQKYSKNNWSGRLLNLIQNAIDLRKKEQLTPSKCDEIKRTFEHLIIEPINKDFKELVTFQKRMVKYSGHVFYFLDNPDVPPDNNASERGIRKFKVKQKVSGLFRSLNGAEIYATIMSVVDTAIKQGQSPLFELQKQLALDATE
jgi:transposase